MHPNPKHARAKEQLKALQKLGIENFADVPINYWEPLMSGETTTEHNIRRQKKYKALDEWMRKDTKIFILQPVAVAVIFLAAMLLSADRISKRLRRRRNLCINAQEKQTQ